MAPAPNRFPQEISLNIAATVFNFELQQNARQAAAVYGAADKFDSNFFPGLVFSVADFFKR